MIGGMLPLAGPAVAPYGTQEWPAGQGRPAGHAGPDDAAEIFDRVISRLFLVGLLLQSTESLPAESVRRAVADAVEHLDETIREMRDVIFTARG